MSHDPVEQLRAALHASGLTAGRFAREVLLRDPRTVRRWIAGKAPIPQAILAWLAQQTIGGANYTATQVLRDIEDGNQSLNPHDEDGPA